MQLVRPASYHEAIEKIGNKTPIGSKMLSAEWSDVPVALRERAMFSSQVESVRFLQRAQNRIADFLEGATETTPEGPALKVGGRADFVQQLREFAIAEGMGDLVPERDRGSIKDITSERRLGLIFDVQTRQADDYGYWRQGMDSDVLNEFPAQRFIRVQAVKQERESHAPYENQVYLKTDPIWVRINADFGVPWGPWGWGCMHDVEDVDRDEAEQLGLIERGQRLEPERKSFNENLQASTYGLVPELIDKLKKDLGEQLIIDEKSGTMRWKGGSPQ